MSAHRCEDPIVATGLGAVTPLGVGANALIERWSAGESGIAEGCGSCSDFCAEEHLSRREVRLTDRFSQLALVAAAEAVDQAGWKSSPPAPPDRIGCVIGTGFGGVRTIAHEQRKFSGLELGALSPHGITKQMHNAPAALLAARHSWHGESFALTAACAAGTQAIGAGIRMLQLGLLDAVAVGATEAAGIDYVGCAFATMGALSGHGESRPYDVARDGFVIGEGAGVLLLERESSAERRGAPILGRIVGYAASTDGHHSMAAPSPAGEGLATAIGQALRYSGLQPADLDYINPHGASSRLGDAIETLALKAVLGAEAQRIPISSTKSAIGHLMGAAGAVEAVAALLALRAGVAPPTLGLSDADPDLDLWYVPSASVRLRDRSGKGELAALSFNFGLGGHNAALVMSRASKCS